MADTELLITNDQVRVCLQRNKIKKVRLSVLNDNDNVVDSLESLLVSGNFTVDSENTHRRECDLVFTYSNRLNISPSSAIWFNKRMKVEVGIKDWLNEGTDNEWVWFNLGIYLYSEADISISTSDRTVEIKGVDKMALLTEEKGQGVVDVITNFDVNLQIDEAIRTVVRDLAGEKKYLIDDILDSSGNHYMIPYKVTEDAGSTLYQCILDLSSLYKSYDFYYDINGVFRLNKLIVFKNNNVFFDMSELNEEYNTSYTITTNLDNVKNDITIIGKSMNDGSQPRYHYQKTNAIDSTSLFTVEKIGIQKYVLPVDSLQTVDQCKTYAEYEMLLKCDLQEKIKINCVGLYFLNDVNKILYISYPENNIEGKYKIDRISGNLDMTDSMTLELSKILENEPT